MFSSGEMPLAGVVWGNENALTCNVFAQFKEIAIAYQTLSDPALRLVAFLASRARATPTEPAFF